MSNAYVKTQSHSLPLSAAGASPAPQQKIHIPLEKLCLTLYFPRAL